MTRRCVMLLERNERNIYLSTSELLLKIVDTVLQEPTNPKARNYRLASPAVSQKLRSTIGAMECLCEMGFQEVDGKLVLLPEASLKHIREIRSEIIDRRRNYETFHAVNSSTEVSSANIGDASATRHIQKFKTQLWGFSEIVLDHENKALQKKAMKSIPLTELEIKAVKHMRSLQKAIKNGADDNGTDVQDILLLQLMTWFKESFFSWVDAPKCWFCQGETKFHSLSSDPKYVRNGDRAEVFICNLCQEVTHFIRYTKTEKLLETRKGRCSEWAKCFALMCRSLGWDVRVVYDVTDHLWVEVFSVSQQRWIHCDPCENAYDKPLMYEGGWKKNLSYIIALSYDDVQDVTWRYTCNFGEVLRRRKLCSEQQLLDTIFAIRETRQHGLSLVRKKYLKKRTLKELVEFLTPPKQTDLEYEGRTSGSLLWRLARGEVTQKVTYVWSLTAAEIAAQRFQLSYSCEQDKYFRSINNETCISGWQNGVFEFDSLFRKEEKDWKTFYLSRTEGSSKGTITWKFDFSSSGLVIETVTLRFVRRVFENGIIKFLIKGDANSLEIPSNETTVGTNVLDGSKYLILTAELSGGRGPAAWQHAQLFREPVGSTTSPFFIDIKLRT